MKTVELGRTGEQVSQLALGCMLMGTTTDEASANTMLNRYLDAGGTFLDTANCYTWWEERGSLGGHSEEVLGRWFASTGRRDDVFLATKGTALVKDLDAVWVDDQPDWERAYQNFDGAGGDNLRRSVDDSLRRLQTDHIDLYYVHVDDRSTPLEESLEALAGLVQAGKIRYIGWSNVRTWRLERIRQLCAQHGWPAPVAVQQQHSYLRRKAGLSHISIVDDEQLDYLQAHDDLTLVAYSPILKGIYDDAAKRAKHPMMALYAGPDADARIAAVEDVAAEVDATPNQVVLAWLLHQTSPTIVPLMGPRTLEQYDAGIRAVDVKLTSDQLGRLDAAGA
ncbi:aldo/keto reductase [Phytoactinopolyspora alkaliphila]|uniref:Aldo/keto reductase n=1 Tax=Phytoactinopolyspora alkaliphila TaxID=1783498 RepID=A0A6N9YIR0_9ACTN|nr:aldo/keto reductase [Phytoactinopolyspora alkaliphila]NED94800.1 aldo/keto reductase [Phytoactinopolyspora alkaliphila]